MFDLRHLEHSTIIYEDAAHTPLLRLAWNKQVILVIFKEVISAPAPEKRNGNVPCNMYLYRKRNLGFLLSHSNDISGPQLPCDSGDGRLRGDHLGRPGPLHPRGPPQQPQGMRKRHCLGAPLFLPRLHSRRRPSGMDSRAIAVTARRLVLQLCYL